MLGEFEYFLLCAAARLGEEAYGAAIWLDIEEMTGRKCSVGALYTTLERLEKKGYVKTWLSEPVSERGGRAKKMVRLTAKGRREAQAFYEAVSKMSKGVIWTAAGGGRP